MNCGLDNNILSMLNFLIFDSFTVVIQKNVFVLRKYILKLCVCVFISKYIHMWRERERERERISGPKYTN